VVIFAVFIETIELTKVLELQ